MNTINETAAKEIAERSKRDFAARAILQVISQDPNFASAKGGLDYLLGEIRDLELERNKLEMDAAHWKEKFEDAERTIREAETHIGQTVR